MGGFQNDSGVTQQEAGFGYDDRYWTESYSDNLVARAGGGQSGATRLPSMFNRVTTVATAGDSVALPQIGNKLGLTICVVNDAAKPMQVFGAGSDTINGVAAASGVTQMQSSVVYYQTIAPGRWHAQGLGSGYAASQSTFSTADGLTATGSNQATALPITTSIARFTTVAASTGAVLMAAKAGLEITVCNAGANALSVYAAAGTDVINALANATAFSIPTGKSASFYCTADGQWHTLLSA